jgi:hypothetical protein
MAAGENKANPLLDPLRLFALGPPVVELLGYVVLQRVGIAAAGLQVDLLSDDQLAAEKGEVSTPNL